MPRRAPQHAFKPGQSGNPAGRPKGSGVAGKLRTAIGERLEQIIAAMIQRAQAGDVGAAKLLLDRVLPPLRPESLPVRLALPEGDLSAQGRAVLAAIAEGRIGINEGAMLLGNVGALARIVEVAELEQRIAALEAAVDSERSAFATPTEADL